MRAKRTDWDAIKRNIDDPVALAFFSAIEQRYREIDEALAKVHITIDGYKVRDINAAWSQEPVQYNTVNGPVHQTGHTTLRLELVMDK